MPTKYRSDAEPDPFIIEIDFTADPWSLREVTSEVTKEAEVEAQLTRANQQDLLRIAAHALATHLRGLPAESGMAAPEAELFLRAQGLKRHQARNLLDAENGTLWERRQAAPPTRKIGFYARAPQTHTHAAASKSDVADPYKTSLIDTS